MTDALQVYESFALVASQALGDGKGTKSAPTQAPPKDEFELEARMKRAFGKR